MVPFISMGELFRQYGTEYIARHNIRGQHKGLIHLLADCRTKNMGSHFEQCNQCGHLEKAYNSCRNRHCPNCQQKDRLAWMNKRMQELLPVGYYHLVFTIPHELKAICFKNKKVMYNTLFQAASQTILELCEDPKHLGAKTGLISVLHTWGQNMMEHPHLHIIMPKGGLSFDGTHWVMPSKKDDFLIHYKVLSRKFRGKFLWLLQRAYDKSELKFNSELISLNSHKGFESFIAKLKKKEWVVNIQKPMGKADKILEYLSRYVFRIAISDRRIKSVCDGKVLFSWKNYRRGGLFQDMELDIYEFIRRFLLHTLPTGFLKVRYYGIFSCRHRKANIALAKQLFQQEELQHNEEAMEDGQRVVLKQDTVWAELKELIQNYRKPNCPNCKKGHMRFAGLVWQNPLEPG
jgi:hypothetical protein